MKKLIAQVHNKAIFAKRANRLAELVGASFPSSAHVLDVGTGTGEIAKKWLVSGAAECVEGVDVFVRPETHIPVKEFDGRILPAEKNSFDVVTFVDVLHHTNNVGQLLSEASRVARHSIVIKDHVANNFADNITLRLMDWVGNAPHGVVLPYNYLSAQSWHDLFDERDLELRSFQSKLGLYPKPLNWIFGRSLHFVAALKPTNGLG